ncbi:hypothetical protein [Streptomyces gilvosporeus]|uniref:hypothetical protein n=1 Tax=Streptomyces gilvosporeus TaxID=553510 RepID=UPI0030027FDA
MRAAIPEAGGAEGAAGENGTGAFVGGAECEAGEAGEAGEGAFAGRAECEACEDGEGAFADCVGFGVGVGVGLQASCADQWWCWCGEESLFDRAYA